MIYISKLASGVLLQRDEAEIVIDDRAIPSVLGIIIGELITSTRVLQAARLSGYEAGLVQGRINACIEHDTSERIAERQAEDLVDALVGTPLASAA